MLLRRHISHPVYFLWLIMTLFFFPTGSSAGSLKTVDSAKAENIKSEKAAKEHQVVFYYFHRNVRCHTCTQFEQWVRQIIKDDFGKENALILEVVNVDKEQNAHFIKEYNLYGPEAVISDQSGKKEIRWTNLPKIWDYSQDFMQFREYIIKSVQEYLNSNIKPSSKTNKIKMEAEQK